MCEWRSASGRGGIAVNAEQADLYPIARKKGRVALFAAGKPCSGCGAEAAASCDFWGRERNVQPCDGRKQRYRPIEEILRRLIWRDGRQARGGGRQGSA